MKWYFFKDQKCKGPVDEAVLKDWLEKGEVEKTTPVRTDSMENWIPLSEALEFFGRMPEPPKTDPETRKTAGYALSPSDLSGGPDTDLRSLLFGFLRGIFVALIGGWVWAQVTLASEMQFGFIAIFVGLLTGLGVRLFGDPESLPLALVAAVCGFAGILFGNFLSIVSLLAEETGVSMMQIWNDFGFDGLYELLGVYATPIDFAFYAVGTIAAFQTARTKSWLKKN